MEIKRKRIKLVCCNETGECFLNATLAAQYYGLSCKYVSYCLKGWYPSSGYYTFRYKTVYEDELYRKHKKSNKE